MCRDFIGSRFGSDRRAQRTGSAQQVGFAAFFGQTFEPGFYLTRELHHFRIFSFIADPAAGDCAGIIDSDVVEKPPGRLDVCVASERLRWHDSQ